MSKVDYGDTVFYPLPDFLLSRLQRIQFAAASFVVGRYVNNISHVMNIGWLPIRERRDFHIFKLAHKALFSSSWPSYVDQQEIENAESFNYLGVIVKQNMCWADHVDSLCTKVAQRIGTINRVRKLLPLNARLTLYNSLVSPLFSYADFVWGDKNNAYLMSQLRVLQNKAAKIVLDMPMHSSATEVLDKLGWKSLEKILLIHRLTMAFKYLYGHIDIDLDVKLNRNVHSHDTRRRTDVRLPLSKRNWGQQRCIYRIFKDWNNLDYSLKEIDCLMNLKYSIKNIFK